MEARGSNMFWKFGDQFINFNYVTRFEFDNDGKDGRRRIKLSCEGEGWAGEIFTFETEDDYTTFVNWVILNLC